MQGDADTDLSEYPSGAFDAVILSNTIQATERPRVVLDHLLRIGRRTAVSLPNFGYWKIRLSLLASGRMPRTRNLDYSWFDTPNIHLCTLSDFLDLTKVCGATVVEAHALNEKGETRPMQRARAIFQNGRCQSAGAGRNFSAEKILNHFQGARLFDGRHFLEGLRPRSHRIETGGARAGRNRLWSHRGIKRLGHFHHMHTAYAGEKALAEFFPTRAGADQRLGVQGRRIKGAVPEYRFKQYIAQKRVQLAA